MNTHLSQPPFYKGRFAPTPTGPLHMGSLVAALASYLDAKSKQGKWLLRIDDIDPPREVKGAADSILRCLERFGLFWDGQVVYQSKQHDRYEQFLDRMVGDTYQCVCSRKQIGSGGYLGVCFGKNIDPTLISATRFRVNDWYVEFDDQIQLLNSMEQKEDFIVRRKDGLWAYHFAVVVDDYLSGITDVVRGVDLLESTFCHIQLQKQLNFNVPRYTHIPVLVEANGQKLSKQNLAKPVGENARNIRGELTYALAKLNINVQSTLDVEEILRIAVEKWDANSLKGKKTIKI